MKAFTQVFHSAAVQLRREGMRVFSPAELPFQRSWVDYMKVCIPEVCLADKVYVLPQWEKSRGG